MSNRFNWVFRPMNGDIDFGEELNKELPPVIRRLLTQRGIRGAAMATEFLHPRLAALSDPFAIKQMDCAVERILRAIDGGEYVCIYGDYDVDGVSSVTLLHEVLKAYGAEHSQFIPVRTREGYGLSQRGIEKALAGCARKPGLLITVDCGTSSVDEVEQLNRQGIDVVILDHHEAGTRGRPQAAAIVNTKLEEKSDFTYLCSAGVVFKLAHALLKRRHPEGFDLREYLDLVAVATIADIVPLVQENRILTRVGLRLAGHERGNTGLRALVQAAGLHTPLTAGQISFRIGPRINAAGRMDSPQDALELLMTRDPQRAAVLAQSMEEHNRARQAEEERIRRDAMQMLDRDFDVSQDHVIVLGSHSWHPGVVGIVASVLMRRYHRPTFVISIDEHGNGKGSGRSIPGISLVEALHSCGDLITGGGGHGMAAGLELREENIDAFRCRLNEYVRSHVTPEMLVPCLNIDSEITFEELNALLPECYSLLEPFGNANPQPIFMSRNVVLSSAPRRVAGNHLRLALHQGMHEQVAMYFNAADLPLPDLPWDIAYTVERNVWHGRATLAVSIQQIRRAQPQV